MGNDRRRLALRCARLLAATTAALLASSGVALADSASIAVTATDGTSDPAAGVPRTYTLSGNSPTPKRVYVKYRNTGGAPCATSANSDTGRVVGDADWYGRNVNGDFTNSAAFTWNTPGTYQFCIWIASSGDQVVTPITQNITFRSPTGTIGATLNPATPRPRQQATVTVAGASEAPKRVYAKVRPASGVPCAQTAYADTGTDLISGTNVNGAFSLQATTTQEKAGSYMLCLWLADSGDDTAPIAGPQPVPFTVVAPEPPRCVVPSIRSGTKLASAKRKLKAAHCRTGRVVKRYSRVRRGRVIKTNPAAGSSMANGARVQLVVSRGKKRR